MTDEPKVWLSSRSYRGKMSYHARWRDPSTGKWKSKAAGTNRKRALRVAGEIESELRKGEYSELRRIGWSEFVDEHIESMDRAPATVTDTERTLKDFGTACNPRGPHGVTFRMIEAYAGHLRRKGNGVATRNKRLRYIRAALNAAVRRQYLKVNPMVAWLWSREEIKIPRTLTADEKAKLLEACPTEQWRTLVYVALTTGCRIGELLGLEWSRVNLETAQIVVTGTKGHKDRVQPLNGDAVAKLNGLRAPTLRDGGPFRSMRYTVTAKQFQDIVADAGIAHCTLHDLRRTFCTDLARLGVNQLVVQRLAGHASSATTATYYQHIDDGMKREAVARLGEAG